MKMRVMLLLGCMAVGLSAQADLVTEDFAQGNYDPANFVEHGTTGSTNTDGFAGGSSRTVLSTVDDGWVGSLSAPLMIQADLTFTAQDDIAFLAFRSDGLPQANYYNEPADSVYIRMHNFANGQTDTVWGGTDYILDGAPAPQRHINANVGDAFYNNTVRINVVDFGDLIEITLTNLTTLATYDTSFNTTASFGSFVSFASQTARFDNIQISNEPVGNVSAPAVGAGLLLFTLLPAVRRMRRAA